MPGKSDIDSSEHRAKKNCKKLQSLFLNSHKYINYRDWYVHCIFYLNFFFTFSKKVQTHCYTKEQDDAIIGAPFKI